MNHTHNKHHGTKTKTNESTTTTTTDIVEETDPELSNLVESFQKLQKGALEGSASEMTAKHTMEYVKEEIENLKRKQTMIQEQIEAKNKEVHTLRETLLVVNGALQGLQHIQNFMEDKEKECISSSSLPSSSLTSTVTMSPGK